MLGKIPEYQRGKVYCYGAFCGQEPEVLVTSHVELMKPQISKEMQAVHFNLLEKWSLAFATPWFKFENDTPAGMEASKSDIE